LFARGSTRFLGDPRVHALLFRPPWNPLALTFEDDLVQGSRCSLAAFAFCQFSSPRLCLAHRSSLAH
jgi:hypothetical protein